MECCNQNNWQLCRKFYSLYPHTLLSPIIFGFTIGWGGGDPHITSLDGLAYTFNGLGKYIFTRSKQGLFEIQGQTSVLRNTNNSASGTLFTSFAFKSEKSRIFEFDLANQNSNNPYLILFVDKSNQDEADFARNFNFFKEYSCKNDLNRTCTTILSTDKYVQVILENGINLNFSINTVFSNQDSRRISWISCTISLFDLNNINLKGDLEGLMGNFNGDLNDDIIGRDGSIPKDLSEREIFKVCETWKVLSNEDLFVISLNKRMNGEEFEPLFIDEINIDPKINQSCNGNRECIFDASASGILDFGLRTLSETDSVENIKKNKDQFAPIIVFRENITRINWFDNSTIVEITADIIDKNRFNYSLDFRNVTFIDKKENDDENGINISVIIRFKPIAGFIPVIGLMAIDETNLNSYLYYNNFHICNCQSLSDENECLFDFIAEPLDTTANLVECECSNKYEGRYCENLRSECSVGNICNKLRDFGQVCQPITLNNQSESERSYRCVGSCPAGFVPDEDGSCIDDLECEKNPPVCKNGSKCIELFGSFQCSCDTGFFYQDEICQQIDNCRTSLNNCDSICTSVFEGVVCSCYPGFFLNSSSNSCEQSKITIY